MFFSCDFLEHTSPSKIQADEWFRNEESLQIYANGFLNEYTPSYSTLCWGDENAADCIARTLTSEFFTGSWGPVQQGGWGTGDWNALYNINYFLANFRTTPDVSEDVLKHYEGVARFWRAWFYFDKVKTFGAVPWYDAPIDSEDEESLYKGRDSREFVMHKVLEDLDFAVNNCFVSSNYVNKGQINGYIAAGFKSRVCLFEGTYRKYHSVEPTSQKAWSAEYECSEDFLNAAVEAAEYVMKSKVYSISNNAAEVNTQYRKIFNSEKPDYSEVLWFREYINGVIMSPVTWYFNSSTSGHCWSMTKSFMNTYLHRDGSRHTEKSGYLTMPYVEELSSDRDARLAQTVITPGYEKKVSGTMTPSVPNFLLAKTGYQVIKWNIDDSSLENTSLSYNSLPILRYAEILLNYAEAKAELGEFTEDDWNNTIAPLRLRAGVNARTPDNADPYLVDYFNNSVSDKWILEIRRERGIELFMEGRRYDDLMRWHLGELIERSWDGMYLPLGAEQNLNADGSRKVCLVQNLPASSSSSVQYLELSSNPYISLNQNKCLVFELTPRVWTEKMYLRPIPQTAIDVNENLEQNSLWK